MEFAEEYSVQATSGAGSLRTCERLVRNHQAEVQRAAYLLSGEPHAAWWFARRAFLTFFERALRAGEIADQREQLVATLATDYLQSLKDGERPPPPPPTPLTEGELTRFSVDDQRSRIMDALDRLQPRVRATLVLREFNALPEETACQTLDLSPYDLRDGLEPARARLRDAAGAPHDAPVQPLLAQAAIGEPVADIWPDLDEAVQRLHARQATRRRRLVAGVGLVTMLVLVLGTVWLFDLNPFRPNEMRSQELAAKPFLDQPTVPLHAKEAPPPPTPEPTMPDIPVGNVPDRLVMTFDVLEGRIDSGEDGRQVRQSLYDPATGDSQVLDVPEGGLFPSPDGKWLLYREYPQNAAEADQRRNLLAAIDISTGERIWSREFPDFSNLKMVGDSVYAIDWDETPRLVEIDLATGEVLAERTNLKDDLDFDTEDEQSWNFRLLASPDSSRLLVCLNRWASGGGTYGQVLATYALPGLEYVTTTAWEYDSEPFRDGDDTFAAYDAQFTPDGAALYAPSGDSVQFLTIGGSEPLEVEIPFHSSGEYEVFDTRWVRSNNGRYLYILALERMEVAVVDLLTQSVDLVVPFDHGGFALQPDVDASGSAGTVSSFGAVLSPDGRRMYLLGGWEDTKQPVEEDQTAIWVIDVATWTVTNRIVIPGWPAEVMWTHGGDRLIIRSRPTEAMADLSGFDALTVFDAASGRVLPGFDVSDLPEWVDNLYWVISIEELYRRTYDRRPTTGGVVPATVEMVSTLPRLEVIAEQPLVPSGAAVNLDLRILDPATGEPLATSSRGVRFDPSFNPILVLHQRESGAEAILVPSQVAPGQYSGIAPVEQVGPWDVEVRFGSSRRDVARANLAEVFTVTPSIPADDGELYTLRVQAEPGSPPESAEWTVRASVVNIDTGQVLPEGVSLELDLSDHLTVTFEHEEYVFFTTTLDEARHGVYESKARFRGPGSWTSSVTLRAPSSTPVSMSIQTGTVVVGNEES